MFSANDGNIVSKICIRFFINIFFVVCIILEFIIELQLLNLT